MDSPLSGMTATCATEAPAENVTLRCEQAIFTSVRTPMGEGYRVIAASAGLSAQEKIEITRQSPSHGGLCGGDGQATAVAFYQLPGGRLCAALSCTAGKEQSGRGGLRVYTRAVAFAGESFSAFAYNPFNVLRTIAVHGLNTPELKPGKTLPAVELPANSAKRADQTITTISRVGVDWLSYVLQSVMTDQRLILAGEGDPSCLVEAAILGIPGPLRRNVSFTCGLKFSIGRAPTLTGITGDIKATERMICGHPLVLVHPQADTPPPPFERSPWQRMVADYWTEAAHAPLQDFVLQDFPDCSLPALERIAALRNDTNHASVSGAAELLATLERRVEQADADEFEQLLLSDLFRTIRMRLEQIWSRATESELTADWPALVALVRKSPTAFQHTIPLVGLVLRRLASTTPPTALERALEISGKPAARAIRADLRAVLNAVEAWLPQADIAERQRLDQALAKWPKAFPGVA